MDIETLRVRIEAETSGFKQQIQSLKTELESLQKSVSTGTATKAVANSLKSTIKSQVEALKSLQKDLDKSYKDFGNALGKQYKNSPIQEKLYQQEYGINYTEANQQLNEMIDKYSLLEKETAAVASEIRQQTKDTIVQNQEISKQISLGQSLQSIMVKNADALKLSKEEWEFIYGLVKKYTAALQSSDEQVRAAAARQLDLLDTKIKSQLTYNKELQKENELHKKSSKLVSSFKHILFYRALRWAIAKVTQAITESLHLLVRYDKELNSNNLGYNKSLSDLTSAFKRLGASITAVIGQLLNAFGPALTWIINGLTKIANMLSALFAMLNGQYTYTVANPNYWQDYADSLDDSNKSAKELKKTLASFDELERLNDNSSSSSSTGINPNDMYITKELSAVGKWFADINKWLKEKLWDNWFADILTGVGVVYALLKAFGLLEKITNLVRTAFGKKNTALEKQTGLEKAAALAVAALGAAYALLGDKIKELLKKMKEGLDGAMQDAKDWWEEKKQQTADGWATVGALAASAWAALTAGLKSFLDGWNTETDTGLETGKLTWTTKLAAILTAAVAFCMNLSNNFGTLMENIGQNIGEGWSNIASGFSTGMEKVGSKISEWGTSLAGWFADLWNSIGSTITSGVNSSIDKINGLVTAYKRAKAEDYANQVSAWQKKVATAKALGLTTAIAFIYTAFRKISLPRMSSLMPSFANGGVLTSPTVGLMGEYPGARSNPEIVTPENKMRDVFNEGNVEMLVELKKNNALLAELLNKDTSITIGDDTISAAAARGNRNYAKRTGRSQFAV